MTAREMLRSLWGFESFRPGQEEAIGAALDERDALVVMPTGAGKSLCYQLPALVRQDLTLVVSPLVSLMHDQAQALEAVAPGRVALINAQRAGPLNGQALERAAAGEIRLLYVAPERFASRRFQATMAKVAVGLFVIDEAHCVSQWGHDFRPDYFTLAGAARRLGARSTLALTATATPRVADDIAGRLELREPVRVTTGFDRPNLFFSVTRCRSWAEKRESILAALSEPASLPAIVYTGTRRACEQLGQVLGQGLDAEVVTYHAGLDRIARAAAQERFMHGSARIIVATNAFGMGIDKPDVRTVCHAAVPSSLEAYYQEAGRAGRDGRPARCLLFAEPRDKGLQVYFIQRARLADDAFAAVAERLCWAGLDGRYDLPLSEVGSFLEPQLDPEAVRTLIGHLARAGMVVPEPSAPDRAAGAVLAHWEAGHLVACRASARAVERARWAQYRAMWEYVEGERCRRVALLSYFGDAVRGAAGSACCDVCAGTAATKPVKLRAA
jgi:ATP-dependent DNA helicase RecQ